MMTHLLFNVTTNPMSFYVAQSDAHSLLVIESVIIANTTAPFANPFITRPVSLFLVISDVGDHRTTLLLPGNQNLGPLASHVTLKADNIYRSEASVYTNNTNFNGKNVTFTFYDINGSPLVFTPGTRCTVKITLK